MWAGKISVQNQTDGRSSSRHRLASAALSISLALALAACSSSLADMSASTGNMFSSSSTGSRQAQPVTMFVASTRKDDRRAGAPITPNGAHFALNIVSVPPGHRAGKVEQPAFGSPRADQHFVLTNSRAVDPTEFQNQIATYISGRVGTSRDVLLYVHGFNTSAEEARFRLAQIVADGRFGGLPVLFTWPSKSNVFSYVSDKESATASRDALEQLLTDLSHTPGVGRIHVLAHSMGTWLAMEALRESAIAGHPDLDGRLGDIMLAAPDIDLAVFRQQMTRLGQSAHVSVFVSRGDRALALSSRLAGERQRVGAMDPSNARDRTELERLGVKVYDLSGFSDGFIGHGAYADAPEVIRSIGAQLAEPRGDDANTTSVIDAGADRSAPPTDASSLPPLPAPQPVATAYGETQSPSSLSPRMISAPGAVPAASSVTTPTPASATNTVSSQPLPPMQAN